MCSSYRSRRRGGTAVVALRPQLWEWSNRPASASGTVSTWSRHHAVGPHALAGLDLASEQPFRELVLQQPLDGSPQRARPVLWVEAGVRQVLDRLVRHLSRWARIRRATRPSSAA